MHDGAQIGFVSQQERREGGYTAPPPEERWKTSLRCLDRIGKAIKEMEAEGQLLGDITDATGKPILSWRIVLLPYLGYEGLYRQFRLNEPWDSSHNSWLIQFVPDVYENLDGGVGTSSYLGLWGTNGAFDESKLLDPSRLKDGRDVTLAVIDVGAGASVPWTKPEDIPCNNNIEFHAFPTSRWIGSIVGLTASGEIVRMPSRASRQEKWAAVTVTGGDGPTKAFFETLSLDSTLSVDEAAVPELKNEMENKMLAEGGAPTPSTPSTPAKSAVPPPLVTVAPEKTNFFALPTGVRFPVPSKIDLDRMNKRLKELYAERTTAARTSEARNQLAKELLEEGRKMTEDATGGYAVLQAARNLALGGGDFDTLMAATDAIVDRYEVEPVRERVSAFKSYEKVITVPRNSAPQAGSFVVVGLQLMLASLDRDDYVSADAIADLLNTYARRNSISGITQKEMSALRTRVQKARGDFGRISALLQAGYDRDTDDKAAAKVGEYLCYIKGDWSAGLPLLARGDGKAANLAKLESDIDQNLDAYVHVANGWYTLGETASDELIKSGAYARALLWYQHIQPHLDGTVEKLEVSVRLKAISGTYISLYDNVRELLNRIAPAGNGGGASRPMASE